MRVALLGYGPVGELLLAVEACKRDARQESSRRSLTDGQLRVFAAYSRMLAIRYPHYGSGADAADVEQVAMLAALDAAAVYRPGKLPLEAFVKQRMRYRVIDFVRLRGQGQQYLDRMVASIDEDQ